ncbi:MAG TPA: c-type cytochrome domain-containing protein [Acidobacteriaceae bacterium]|nr:c-type cytochrome domain-containing protein [Acidobacteriaceae bacterium]
MKIRQVIHGICAPGLTCVAVLTIAAGLAYGSLFAPRVLAAAHASPPDYSEVAPIFARNCGSCHSSVQHKSGLVIDNYSALMKGGRHGAVVVAHDAKDSKLMRMLEGELDPQMPLDADPLAAAELAKIRAWIEAGAPGPASDTSAAPSIEPGTGLRTGPEIKPEVNVISPVTSVRFSPDGTMLAVGGNKEVRLIDSVSGKVVARFVTDAGAVRSLAFSPDGQLLAAAGGAPQIEGEIDIWNVASRQKIRTIRGHRDCIYSIAWSPDGKLIASGSYDRMIKLWDAGTGKELRNLQDHIDAVFAVAFSPDGRLLASASQDRTVKIWDVATGKRLYTLSDASDGLNSVAFSRSGDRIAAGGYDKTIYVWKLGEDDGHLSQSLIADEDSLLALVWSPDGKAIITSSSDGSIRFRDAATLEAISVIDRQPDWVEALDISIDGKWLAAGRYDGSLSIYDTQSRKPIRAPMMVFESLPHSAGDQAKEAGGR